MEEALRDPAVDGWRDGLTRSVHAQRQRAAELLAARSQRIRDLQVRFAERLETLALDLANEQADFQGRSVLVQSREEDLAEHRRLLDQQQQQLTREREACEQLRQQVDQRLQELASDSEGRWAELDAGRQELARAEQTLQAQQVQCGERETALDRLQLELAEQTADLTRREAELAEKAANLESQRVALGEQRVELSEQHLVLGEQRRATVASCQDLDRQRQELAHREQETQRQRRQIAQQLRSRKKELTAEVELHRAESLSSAAGSELQLQMRLSELQGKHERLRDELARRDEDRETAGVKLAELEGLLAARQQAFRDQHSQSEQLTALQLEQEAAHQRAAAQWQAQLEQARQEAELARRELTTANIQAAEAAKLQVELDRVRREAQQQIDALQNQQNQSHDQQVISLRAELDGLRKEHEVQRAAAASGSGEWDRHRKQLEAELTAARQSQTSSTEAAKEVAKLREENKQLEIWLREAEGQAKQAAAAAGPDIEDLRKRFEVALQDVRELKTKNAELSEQLAKARRSVGPSPAVGGGGLDWEAQKRKLLEQLELDLEESEEDKLTVAGAIKITDQVVAERDQEITELRRLLENQSQNVGDVAVGASAIAQMFDTDELIRQERESLKQLQAKLQDELMQAEVNISLERAKIARDRAELDEKLRQVEAERSNLQGEVDSAGNKGKPARGKWLARLGLKDGK